MCVMVKENLTRDINGYINQNLNKIKKASDFRGFLFYRVF